MKKRFRVDEVAEYFRVSRSTVYLWIKEDLIRRDAGGCITREEVEKMRARNRIKPRRGSVCTGRG